jgi:hypothetical protein
MSLEYADYGPYPMLIGVIGRFGVWRHSVRPLYRKWPSGGVRMRQRRSGKGAARLEEVVGKLLPARPAPETERTRFAGYKKRRELDWRVRRGEEGLEILAPSSARSRMRRAARRSV